MSQLSFMSVGLGDRRLRCVAALEEISAAIPWERLAGVIAPYYPKGLGGRPVTPLLLMLKIHCLQQWYHLSDPAMEDAIYDRNSFQQFLGVDLLGAGVPDESTILSFRHLLERHSLGQKLFEAIAVFLQEKQLLLREGGIVDATIIRAPSGSARTRARQAGMSMTKKGNAFFFGMKAHIGVDASSGLVHSLACTTAKTADIAMLETLLHGDERAVFGDKGYARQSFKRQCRERGIFHGILDKAERYRKLSPSQQRRNRTFSPIRAKVEHPFRIVKHLWGHTHTRYLGLAKNTNHFYTLFALSNLYRARKKLAPA